MKLLDVFSILLKDAEKVVPHFVVNPKSQNVEGIIFTAAEVGLAAAKAIQEAKAPAPAATPAQ